MGEPAEREQECERARKTSELASERKKKNDEKKVVCLKIILNYVKYRSWDIFFVVYLVLLKS